MLYQLPTGKVIRITVEQYLDLTDDDIAYLCNPANNHGTHVGSLWTGSVLKNRKEKPTNTPTSDDDIHSTTEDDEVIQTNSYQEEEYLEDFPEVGEDIVDESTELD
jgi:hypothetical protein